MHSLSSPDMVVKNRKLGFLIWQFISSTSIFIIFKFLLLSPLLPPSKTPIIAAIFAFIVFNISQLLFSASFAFLSSPHPVRAASPLQLLLALLRPSSSSATDFRSSAKLSLSFLLFLAAAAVSGFLAIGSVCCAYGVDGLQMIGRVGFRGFAFGFLYGLLYILKQRWILDFPIIQRPPFFSFKMGLPSAITRALRLSGVYYLFSALLLVLLPDQIKSQLTMREFIYEEIVFYMGTFAVLLCWELNHHLHKVLLTKRCVFAPPKGSAAAETNPSELLLATLEESPPASLLQYLAYLDLCMVCQNNVDTWRRAAFFEETGETYKRVVAVCLRPLLQLASKLAESLECCSAGTYKQPNPLQQQQDPQSDLKFCESLNHFQLYAWCAQAAASVTAHSRKEDRLGVAQLSGSNAAIISTLLSCLLAVEAFMGKKTNLQPSHHFMGPAGIKWATLSGGRREIKTLKKRGGSQYSKAYAIADVLRTSVYCVVCAFHDEMMTSAKGGSLDKDWVINTKPLFGTHELLAQKLRLFLDFQAT